jgi:hypothetical protein
MYASIFYQICAGPNGGYVCIKFPQNLRGTYAAIELDDFGGGVGVGPSCGFQKCSRLPWRS